MVEELSKLTKKELIEKLKNYGEVNTGNINIVSDYDSEFDKINQLATVSNPHKIPFVEKNDHKNVMLYTALNKRVGPLHPENAKRTMARWKKAGIQLYTTPRTIEQIEKFKETSEYKIAHEKHLALRKSRQRQSNKGRTEKMIADIAKVTAEAVAGRK